MSKKDAFTLWEQEGDLERMKLFFQEVDSDLEQKERIKQLALNKIREEESASSRTGLPASELRALEKDSWYGRLGRMMRSFWWSRQWKYALPVAALVLFIVVGKFGMEGFGGPGKGLELTATQSAGSSAAAPAQSPERSDVAYDQKAAPMIGAGAESKENYSFGSNSTAEMDRDNGSMAKGMPAPAVTIAPVPVEPQAPPADSSLPRKITYTMNASLQVEDVNQALEQISRQVTSLGGYVVQSSQSQYQSDSSAYLSLKLPSSQLESFRTILQGTGKVLNQDTSSNDVTNQYYDSEARLRTLEAQENRYLEILKEAKSVEDILKIESYLSDVRIQIEQLKGQLKLWDHEVAYSTVNINLQTTPNPVNVNDPWQPISWSKTWRAAQDAILKAVSSAWNGLNMIVVGIAYTLPYLALIGVIYGVYRIVKTYRK